jgi:hypothetical protein
MIDYILNREEKTIRGGFINALITFTFLGLIVSGIFDSGVKESIIALQHIMIWFFSASFGIWSLKKSVEAIAAPKVDDNTDTPI